MLSRQLFDPASGELQYGKYKHSSSYPIDPRFGGTGANNSGANAQMVFANTVTFAGNYATTITSTGTTSVTLPTSGTLIASSGKTISTLTPTGAFTTANSIQVSYSTTANVCTLCVKGIAATNTFSAAVLQFTLPAAAIPLEDLYVTMTGADGSTGVFVMLQAWITNVGTVYLGRPGAATPGAFTGGSQCGFQGFSASYFV